MDFLTGLMVVLVGVPTLVLIISLFSGELRSSITGAGRLRLHRPPRPSATDAPLTQQQAERRLREWFDAMSARPLYWFEEK